MRSKIKRGHRTAKNWTRHMAPPTAFRNRPRSRPDEIDAFMHRLDAQKRPFFKVFLFDALAVLLYVDSLTVGMERG